MLNGRLNGTLLTFGIKDQVIDLKLERIASTHLNVLNALYRSRPWPVRIGQQDYQVNAEWRPEPAEIINAWTIIIQAQDSKIELVVDQSILQHCLAKLDPSLILSDLSEDLRAMLLELVLEQTLERFEETFRTSLAILAVVREARPAALDAPVIVALRIKSDTKLLSLCLLRLASADLARFGMYIDHSPEHKWRFADVSLPLHVRWGVVELPIIALQNLSPGDIILPDDVCDDPDTPMLVIADQFIAKGERDGDGYRLLDELKRMETSNVWMQYQSQHADGAISDISAKEANVRVVFELGRSEISRKAAGTLNAYDVVHVCSASNSHVNIVVDGTRIGRGTLTSIGNAVGVRVTRL